MGGKRINFKDWVLIAGQLRRRAVSLGRLPHETWEKKRKLIVGGEG